MKERISRRRFLQQSAAIASTVPLAAGIQAAEIGKWVLPKRTLGRTGLKVTRLVFGGGSFFQKLPDGQWEPLLQRAVDVGINYFDNFSGYNFDKTQSHSEFRFGQILPKYRKNIYVCTKLDERDVEKAKKELEGCLERLKMDRLDVLMAHGLRENETDVSVLEKGIFSFLRKMQEEKVTRFIGFSSMIGDGILTRKWIEAFDPDVALIAISATRYGNVAEPTVAAAKARHTGYLAMKLLRDVVGKNATAKELLQYGLAIPDVAALCVSHSSIQELEENIQTVCEYGKKADAVDPKALEKRLAHLATPEVLSWARPGYTDSGNPPSVA